MEMNEERVEELIDEMLSILAKETEQPLPQNLTDESKLRLLKNLMIIRPIGYLDENFLKLQNEFLTYVNENRVVHLDLKKLKLKKHEIDCDILDIDADLIVVFSNNLIGDGSLDENLDNRIILKAGLQAKDDIAKIYHERNGAGLNMPYYVSSYNLPSKYFAKILIDKSVVDCKDYLHNYIGDIFNFAKENNLTNVVFDLNSLIDVLKIQEKNLKMFKKSIKILILKEKLKQKSKCKIIFNCKN